MNKEYVDTSRVSLDRIPKKVSAKIVSKYHYSGKLSSCRYALGLYYKTDNQHKFFDDTEEHLIGTLTYGFPKGRRVVGSIFNEDIIGNRNILELTRLCVKNGFGSNIESYAISQSFKWLKKYAPDVKVLISYADPEQNHAGFIYQATNWLYQGQGAFQAAPTYALRLEEDGEWMHSRNVYSRYGSSNVEHLKKQIGHTFWLKKEAEKHRYIYFLGNKRENKVFMKSLKHKLFPYPKEANSTAEIQKIEVINESFN